MKDEIKKLKKDWKTSGPIFKIFIAISFFIYVSSIASLSETIFKWKGFILDGIEFYREWINRPVRYVFRVLNLNLDRYAIDTLVVTSMVFVPLLRSYFKEVFKMKRKTGPNLRFKLSLALLILVTLFVFGFAIYDLSTYKGSPSQVALAIVLTVTMFITVCKEDKKNIKLFIPVLFAILIVLILGAISSVLSK